MLVNAQERLNDLSNKKSSYHSKAEFSTYTQFNNDFDKTSVTDTSGNHSLDLLPGNAFGNMTERVFDGAHSQDSNFTQQSSLQGDKGHFENEGLGLSREVADEEGNIVGDLMRLSRDDETLSNGGGGAGGSTTTTVSAFPSIAQIAGDSVVEAARASDWSAGTSDYKERAGWVLWDSKANTFSVTGRVTGTEDGVNPGPTPGDSAPVFCVGHYHQHPPLNPSRDKTKFPVGPSGADKSFANSRNNPGIVRDFTDVNRTTVTDYTYGPTRRA